ncbi:AEC family transporter [Clostridium estertheticum]|uniref:AEC family transporter n=1 Tax=Clostridium estertheticum TaxID=238834 RepID=UPI001C0B5062|nr:AEC family transporter [Clostridium estertheticum]MBU3178554.1 AEC family transporter [Clostridium estertheticum]
MNINVMNQVIILALMMMVGVVLRKTKTITDEVNKGFSNILINLTMPCMIIYSFNFKFSMDMLKGASMILFYSIVIHIILIILSKLLYSKFEGSKKNVFKGLDIYYVNFIKLIVAPLLTYFVLNLLGASKTLLYICVILVAMQTASLIAVLAEKYNGDKVTASKCAFLTTILSIITIPAIMSIIDLLIK